MTVSDTPGQNPEKSAGVAVEIRKPIGLHKMIPNLLTLMALAAGMSAIQFAIHGRWEMSVLAVVAAAILDAMDGATARLIKATSDFGAQLDSLSDFLSFGVAPAFVLYLWVLGDAGRIGWMATVILAMACALRLARFNVMQMHASQRPKWARGFFAGVPAPAAAGLALAPMFLWFMAEDWFPGRHVFSDLSSGTPLIALWTILVAGLMVSRIPTFSTKQIKIPQRMAMPVLALAGLMIAALIHAPWPTLVVLSVAYIALIPLSFRVYRRLEHENRESVEDLADLALGTVELDHLANGHPEEKD